MMRTRGFIARFFLGSCCAYLYAVIFASITIALVDRRSGAFPVPSMMFLIGIFCAPILVPASGAFSAAIALFPPRKLLHCAGYGVFALAAGIAASCLFQAGGFFDLDHEAAGTTSRATVQVFSIPTVVCVVTSIATLVATHFTVKTLDKYIGEEPQIRLEEI